MLIHSSEGLAVFLDLIRDLHFPVSFRFSKLEGRTLGLKRL